MKRRAFYQQQLGTVRPVLFEHHRNSEWLSGFTDNYVKIEIPADQGTINDIQPVCLESLGLDGETVKASSPVAVV
jgi:threonylcarbamoyladenosine tRNA methylthiotransferase MtaB